jgi:hypothetical protein
VHGLQRDRVGLVLRRDEGSDLDEGGGAVTLCTLSYCWHSLRFSTSMHKRSGARRNDSTALIHRTEARGYAFFSASLDRRRSSRCQLALT